LKFETASPLFHMRVLMLYLPPPPLPLLCGKSSEWSDLTINTESK
jgi:hypothetical protein